MAKKLNWRTSAHHGSVAEAPHGVYVLSSKGTEYKLQHHGRDGAVRELGRVDFRKEGGSVAQAIQSLKSAADAHHSGKGLGERAEAMAKHHEDMATYPDRSLQHTKALYGASKQLENAPKAAGSEKVGGKASKLAAFRDKDKPEHQLQQGAKGGQYYINESGRKVYVGKKG